MGRPGSREFRRQARNGEEPGLPHRHRASQSHKDSESLGDIDTE